MTKTEFVGQVASSRGMSKKDTEALVDAASAIAGKAIREVKRFSYPGFGTFSLRERAAKAGRNPRTGER